MIKPGLIIPFCCLLLLSACDLDDPLADFNCEELIGVEMSSQTFMADGEDMITITIRFLNENIKQDTKISLQTDYGTFEGNNMDMIELMVIDRVATAELKSTNVPNDDVVLTVDVGDVCQQTKSLVAVPALPDFIDFQADRLEISANRSERASLTVKLFKNPGEGVVSENTRVTFTSEAIDGSSAIASHPDFAFSENGQVAIDLISANDSTGVVRVTASVEGSSGTITESLDIALVQ